MEKEVLKTGMNAAEAYEAPACDVMELRMEGAILQSSEEPGEGSGIYPPEEGGDMWQ